MANIQCPHCGDDIQVEEGKSVRFCPHCGRALGAENTMEPSPLDERLYKEKNPKKKYRIIKEALDAAPDDFAANRALLFHGRLHESLANKKGLDYSIIKSYLLSMFHTPDLYTPDQLDEKYDELLRGAQLVKTMALSPDAEAFFDDYIFELAYTYVDLFIRGDSRNNSLAFGFNRSQESTARKCVEPVREMLAEIERTERLAARERGLLLRAVRAGYSRVFPGYEKYLDM